MNIKEQLACGVLLLENKPFEDDRGFFLKAFTAQAKVLESYRIQQLNVVVTHNKNVLRGLHYQKGAFAESKYFRVLRGIIQLAFVDMRPGSEHYHRGQTYVLDTTSESILIPRHFATGYVTLTPNVEVLYASDNEYSPAHEAGIRWDDPKINIPWKVDDPALSVKDQQWQLLN
jgi:dTDP-4-dehydrorhamnose 3,5-epimerase